MNAPGGSGPTVGEQVINLIRLLPAPEERLALTRTLIDIVRLPVARDYPKGH